MKNVTTTDNNGYPSGFFFFWVTCFSCVSCWMSHRKKKHCWGILCKVYTFTLTELSFRAFETRAPTRKIDVFSPVQTRLHRRLSSVWGGSRFSNCSQVSSIIFNFSRWISPVNFFGSKLAEAGESSGDFYRPGSFLSSSTIESLTRTSSRNPNDRLGLKKAFKSGIFRPWARRTLRFENFPILGGAIT